MNEKAIGQKEIWGGGVSEPRDYWQEFVDSLDAAIEIACETGKPARISIATDKRQITVDIYETKAQMKVFDEAILAKAKEHRGLTVIKSGVGE